MGNHFLCRDLNRLVLELFDYYYVITDDDTYSPKEFARRKLADFLLPDWHERVFVVEFIGNRRYAKLVPSGALFLKLTLNDFYFDFVAQVVLDLICREL